MYLKQFQNLRIMGLKLTHIINSDHILKNNKQIYFWFIWYDIRHQYIPLIMFLQHNKVQKWVLHVTDNYELKYNLQFLFQKTLFLALKLITSGIVKMFFNIKKMNYPIIILSFFRHFGTCSSWWSWLCRTLSVWCLSGGLFCVYRSWTESVRTRPALSTCTSPSCWMM